MITLDTIKKEEQLDALRRQLDQAILDKNEPARRRVLEELLVATGADPSKMDLTGEIA